METSSPAEHKDTVPTGGGEVGSTVVLRAFATRLNIRMNDHLCDMKPDHDDSITGFNEAWNIATGLIDDILGFKAAGLPPLTEDEVRDAFRGAEKFSKNVDPDFGLERVMRLLREKGVVNGI